MSNAESSIPFREREGLNAIEVFQAFLHDYPDEDGWVDAEEEPPYSPEEIVRVADWLVKEGYAESGYAETLRRAMQGRDGGKGA